MSAGTVKILERFGLFSKKLPDSPGSYTRAARGDCPTTEIIICVSPPYGQAHGARFKRSITSFELR